MRGSASGSQARGNPAPSPGRVFQPALTSGLLLHPQRRLKAVASLVQGALGLFLLSLCSVEAPGYCICWGAASGGAGGTLSGSSRPSAVSWGAVQDLLPG